MVNYPLGSTAAVPFVFPFTAMDLTESINLMPNQWGLLGDLGIFKDEPADSTFVAIDYRNGFLSLLASARRGSIPQADRSRDEGRLVFEIPHFPDMDVIEPKDLENKFAFVQTPGQAPRRRTVEDEMNDRLEWIKLRHDLLREFLRVGAVKGKIYDGQLKLLYDYFVAFNVTQQVFTFNFSDPNFAVREFTYQISRYIELNLHDDVSTGIEVLVDPQFFSALTSHPRVSPFYLQNPTAERFQGDLRKGFTFGSLTFREYNAQVPTSPLPGVLQQQTDRMTGTIPFIEAGTGYAFPMGTRNTFRVYDGPAYHVYMVNQEGVPVFISTKVLDHGQGVELRHQSNPLALCRRPTVLVKVVAS